MSMDPETVENVKDSPEILSAKWIFQHIWCNGGLVGRIRSVMPFPITADEIAKTEKKLGVSFPLGFKARMARNNGGEIEAADDYWQLIPFLDGSDRKRIARTCNDICRETASMRSWRGFPADAFVIAQNGSGDHLILQPSATDSKVLGEEIFFWDHETGQVTRIADSIQEL